MTLVTVLAKLKDAQDLLTKTIPDGLDQAAQATDKVASALRDASAYLRTLDLPKLPFGADANVNQEECVRALKALQEECVAQCVANEDIPDGAGPMKAGVLPPPLKAVLFQLIAEAIRHLLERQANR